jgi:hypothetical protein
MMNGRAWKVPANVVAKPVIAPRVLPDPRPVS